VLARVLSRPRLMPRNSPQHNFLSGSTKELGKKEFRIWAVCNFGQGAGIRPVMPLSLSLSVVTEGDAVDDEGSRLLASECRSTEPKLQLPMFRVWSLAFGSSNAEQPGQTAHCNQFQGLPDGEVRKRVARTGDSLVYIMFVSCTHIYMYTFSTNKHIHTYIHTNM